VGEGLPSADELAEAAARRETEKRARAHEERLQRETDRLEARARKQNVDITVGLINEFLRKAPATGVRHEGKWPYRRYLIAGPGLIWSLVLVKPPWPRRTHWEFTFGGRMHTASLKALPFRPALYPDLADHHAWRALLSRLLTGEDT
jgi:hypothetical protein